MKRSPYALIAVLFAFAMLASGCGLDTSGIPDPCWLTGLCSNGYTAANGWNNCPAGWEPVFKAGDSPYGYGGLASYDVTLPSGDPILGPDGNPEVVVPSLSDPSSLGPIAYCIGPGYQPPWPYIPANGACPPPAIPYLQGTSDYCPDQNASHECVCVPPGVTHVPTATIAPSPTPLVLLPYPVEQDPYCADPAKGEGGLEIWTPNTHDTASDTYDVNVTSGPNWATVKSTGPLPLNAPYHPGLDSTRFLGPAGAQFKYGLCYQGQTGFNNCGYYLGTYGTCAGKTTSPGGSTGCAQPKGGCPSGQFWNGAPQCSCTTIK
jgi:hypothetical protein